ncbi:hypothetical protein BVX98_06475 [bacterium F11]|nr:hypothetical protein BVX98_06475 [bacterium F11]
MNRYLVQSSFLHLFVLTLFFLFHIFFPQPQYFRIDLGFDFSGGTGGGGPKGDGGIKKGTTLDPKKRGQPVPQPTDVPVPDIPAPPQPATKGEETWEIKDKPKTTIKEKTPDVAQPGEKSQPQKTNIIRKGTPDGEKGEKEFGSIRGTGTGSGSGRDIAIGLGPGDGGGFGIGNYGSILYRRILTEWLQYTPFGTNKSCVIAITVLKSGTVTKIKLEESSGDDVFDDTARRAIRNSSPLPPLPYNFPNPEQKFRLKFKLLD